jgi:hypothetical protein
MDLDVLMRVLRRFRVIVAIGVILAAALAFFSYVKLQNGKLVYRSQQTWTTTARALVAADPDTPFKLRPDATTAALYDAPLGGSDQVRAMAVRISGVPGVISATPGFDKETQAALPIIVISAIASSPSGAASLANAGVTALDRYIQQVQVSQNTPVSQQVHLETLNTASAHAATVSSPRSKTRPIMVLVLGLAVTLALVLVLENLRPRLREVKAERDLPDVGREERLLPEASARPDA